MMKFIFFLLAFSFLVSCTKEEDDRFRPYFKLKVNGDRETLTKCDGFLIGGSGGGDFSCSIMGDSVLLLTVGCDVKAGFFIKDMIKNGSYVLDDKNRALYGNYYRALYRTSAAQTGTLIIEKGTFQAFNTIKGQFSFRAIDTISGQTINITNGEFFMQRYQY